jgi:hypothetical protein
MGNMGLPSFYIDENIIKENQDKTTEERMEDMIHEILKTRGIIKKGKWHKKELIMTFMSYACNLGNLLLFHTSLVVTRVEIKFGKILSTT